MSARESPTVTMKTDTDRVSSACFTLYSPSELLKMPPVDEATIRVTTGSNHVADIESSEREWWVILVDMNGKPTFQVKGAELYITCTPTQQQMKEIPTSIHHRAQREIKKPLPPNLS